MISHSHNFTFIHLPKTGGCSIEKSLSPELARSSPAPRHNEGFAINYQHATLREIQLFHPESQPFFSFCFVRNPWDRLVSFYSHISQRNGAWIKQCKPSPMFSFNRMIQNLYLKKFHPSYNHCPYTFMAPCLEWIENISFVGRFENLQSDFGKVCKILKLPLRQLPLLNSSSRSPYESYYTDSSINMVGDLYKKDIEYFGYEFNS